MHKQHTTHAVAGERVEAGQYIYVGDGGMVWALPAPPRWVRLVLWLGWKLINFAEKHRAQPNGILLDSGDQGDTVHVTMKF